MNNDILRIYKKTKFLKLISAITIDSIGILSYLIPVIGENGDWIWGPISGVLIFLLFPNRKKMAILGVAEEMIPFTDFIPTASMAWILEYVKDHEKTLSAFLKKAVGEEQLVQEIQNTKGLR